MPPYPQVPQMISTFTPLRNAAIRKLVRTSNSLVGQFSFCSAPTSREGRKSRKETPMGIITRSQEATGELCPGARPHATREHADLCATDAPRAPAPHNTIIMMMMMMLVILHYIILHYLILYYIIDIIGLVSLFVYHYYYFHDYKYNCYYYYY